MISRLHIENFKCLRDVTIDLTPLTVLIGPNDSGKSSILQAIDEFGIILGGGEFPSETPYNQWVWRREQQRDMVFEAIEGASDVHIKMLIPGAKDRKSFRARVQSALEMLKGEQWIKDFALDKSNKCFTFELRPEQDAALEGILTRHPYKFQADLLRSTAAPEPEPTLDETGSNLAAVLEAMITGPDRASLHELERTLYQAIPTLRGIAVPTVMTKGEGGAEVPLKAIQFVLAGKERPPITIPAEQVSDGAMLLTAYLALAYGDTPAVILIEEPENGLHPSRLQMLCELLRKVSTGEVGNRTRQIIMTTHSPLLLNYCQPEEVRIVRRDAEGATQVTPLTAVPNYQQLLKEFGVGELWYLLGEEALLRGSQP